MTQTSYGLAGYGEAYVDLDGYEGPNGYEDLSGYEAANGYEDLEGGDDDLATDLADVLRDALNDDFADASDQEMDDALTNVLESMSPAESFNFSKALQQIQKSAGQALSDPTVSQIIRTALPIAGGAVGTVVGGPLGTTLGTSLGTAAANAVQGKVPAAATPPATPPATPTSIPAATATVSAAVAPMVAPAPSSSSPVAAAEPTAVPPPTLAPATPSPTSTSSSAGAAVPSAIAGGSAAAAQGLVLSQQRDTLEGLLALAMGNKGKRSVNGVPVPKIMRMLSSVFGQAAADADELMYLDGVDSDGGEGVEWEVGQNDGRSLYTTMLDADNYELAEAADLT